MFQIRYFLRLLHGDVSLPSEQELAKHLQPKEGTARRHYHQLGDDQWNYMDVMSTEAKIQPLNSFYSKMWTIVWWRRIFALAEYKQFNYSCLESNGDYQVVEYHNGRVVNSSLELIYIGFKGLVTLLIFSTPAVLNLLLAKSIKKMQKIFGIYKAI